MLYEVITHNRGQDGAGVVNLKIDQPPGKKYFSRQRSNEVNPIKDVFNHINAPFQKLQRNNFV